MATRALDLDYAPSRPRPDLSVVMPPAYQPGERYGAGARTNWPLIGAIAAAHVAIGALLMATGTIHLAVAPDKPVVVQLIPEPVAPSTPPPQPVELDPVPVAVVVPEVEVETPVSHPSPLITTTVVAPPKAVPAVPVVSNAPPVTAPVTPPDFDADQLNNPGPRYPAMSRRNHEQGVATLKVLVSADGRAEQLALVKTSGFKRLDDAALETVKRWMFVPAKQAGRAVSAWVLVPVTFALS